MALLVLAILAPQASLAEDCDASIRGQLMGERPTGQYTRYTWKADVTSGASCARVSFVLITKEERPDGEVWVTRTPKRTKLPSGTVSVKVDYKVKKGNTLLEWEFEVTSCQLCDSP